METVAGLNQACRTALSPTEYGCCSAESSTMLESKQKKSWSQLRTARCLSGQKPPIHYFLLSIMLFRGYTRRGSPEDKHPKPESDLALHLEPVQLMQHRMMCAVHIRTHIIMFWTSLSFQVSLQGSPA